jgi:hypothetical protein
MTINSRKVDPAEGLINVTAVVLLLSTIQGEGVWYIDGSVNTLYETVGGLKWATAMPIAARPLGRQWQFVSWWGSMIKENWRVILLTLLAANLLFMGLQEMQRLAIWRHEQEYFALVQQPSTERFDFLAKELAEAKKTELTYLDLINRHLDGLSTRTDRLESSVQDIQVNVKETRDLRVSINALRTAVEKMSTAKQ